MMLMNSARCSVYAHQYYLHFPYITLSIPTSPSKKKKNFCVVKAVLLLILLMQHLRFRRVNPSQNYGWRVAEPLHRWASQHPRLHAGLAFPASVIQELMLEMLTLLNFFLKIYKMEKTPVGVF